MIRFLRSSKQGMLLWTDSIRKGVSRIFSPGEGFAGAMAIHTYSVRKLAFTKETLGVGSTPRYYDIPNTWGQGLLVWLY